MFIVCVPEQLKMAGRQVPKKPLHFCSNFTLKCNSDSFQASRDAGVRTVPQRVRSQRFRMCVPKSSWHRSLFRCEEAHRVRTNLEIKGWKSCGSSSWVKTYRQTGPYLGNTFASHICDDNISSLRAQLVSPSQSGLEPAGWLEAVCACLFIY